MVAPVKDSGWHKLLAHKPFQLDRAIQRLIPNYREYERNNEDPDCGPDSDVGGDKCYEHG
jgi:hypothetical protein